MLPSEATIENRTSQLSDYAPLVEDDELDGSQIGGTGDENVRKGSIDINPPAKIKALRNDSKHVRINQPRESLSSLNSVIIKRDPLVESIIESRKTSLIDNAYTRLAQSTRPPQRINPFEIRPTTTETENEIKDRIPSSRIEKKIMLPTSFEMDLDDWADGITEEIEKDNISSADKTSAQLYDETCKRLNICPSTIILRSLHTTKINLGNYGLGPRGCAPLAVGLVRNTTVVSLNLSGNNIGSTGMSHIHQIITENAFIEEYDLSFNNLGTKGNRKLVSAISDCGQLKTLNVAGNKLTHSDIIDLLSELEDHSHLKNLNISHNELGEEGGIFLASWLSDNHVLVNFDASWCSIRLMGAKAMAKAIGENNRLASLDLSHNSFTNDTLVSITSSLTTNTALSELNLRGSHFISRYEGPVKENPDSLITGKNSQIYDMLLAAATNQSLKIFRLGENHIDQRCLMIMLESLAEVEDITLEELDLTGLMTDENLISKGHLLFSSHPKLHVYVGPVKQIIESFANNLLNLIHIYSQENEINISDIFCPGEDLTSTITMITYEQFLDGIRKAKIPFPGALINDIMKYLGKDNEQGSISLRSLQVK